MKDIEIANIITPPFFLGIGPPKTATSWLYKSLDQHPNVNLPPMKEIGYLWEKRFLPERSYMKRFFGQEGFYRYRRKYLIRSFMNHLRNLKAMKINRDKLLWDIHYSLFPHTDSWYIRLFDRQSVCGDITPKYCELKESDISYIKHRYGETKIIISVRDPVEREWSRAKMNLCKKQKRKPQEVSEHEWIRHFEHPDQSSANDYKALYERWSKSFGENNIHLVFYDEIKQDGWAVFKHLCRFLGLHQLPDTFKDRIAKPANVGIVAPLPKSFEKYLFQKHRKNIVRFAQKFPDYPYPQNWLEKHQVSVETID